MTGAGWFFLLLLLILIAYGAWLGWRVYTSRQTGERLTGWKSFVPFMKAGSASSTNYPTPRATGIIDTIKDKIAALRNKRTTTSGGYEDSRLEGQHANLNPSGRRGRGLEDDAWDTRVDHDPYGAGPSGYNEEAELGLAPTPGVYTATQTEYMGGNTSYSGAPQQSHQERGRSAQRGGLEPDPFGDQNEAASLRSVSPRPHLPEIDTRPGGHKKGQSSLEVGNSSPTSTKSIRKSNFREQM